MRKLLYLAAGAALLSAPAAFAQNDSASQPASAPAAAGTGQASPIDPSAPANQAPPSDQAAPADQTAPPSQATDPAMPASQAAPTDEAAPSGQAAPTDPNAAPPAGADQGQMPAQPQGQMQSQPQGQYSSPSQPGGAYYTQAPSQGPYGYGSVNSNVRSNSGSRLYVRTGEQGVQIISNAPIPDTHATRRQFPPLSRAGRRTAPAGN